MTVKGFFLVEFGLTPRKVPSSDSKRGVELSMASLRRVPRSPNYIACFTGTDGKRYQRSTGVRVDGRTDQFDVVDFGITLLVDRLADFAADMDKFFNIVGG